jgi:hypothetical protein
MLGGSDSGCAQALETIRISRSGFDPLALIVASAVEFGLTELLARRGEQCLSIDVHRRAEPRGPPNNTVISAQLGTLSLRYSVLGASTISSRSIPIAGRAQRHNQQESLCPPWRTTATCANPH